MENDKTADDLAEKKRKRNVYIRKFPKREHITIENVPFYTAEEIKQIRESMNITQKTFARVMGVSSKTVEAWESGRNIPQNIAHRFLSILKYGGLQVLEDTFVISK